MKRRRFLKGMAAAATTGPFVTQTGWAIPGDGIELEQNTAPTDLLAACPFTGLERLDDKSVTVAVTNVTRR